MLIRCADLDDLIAVCAGLVQKGVTFDACTRLLTITLTGGY
jgi:hypothetical protein